MHECTMIVSERCSSGSRQTFDLPVFRLPKVWRLPLLVMVLLLERWEMLRSGQGYSCVAAALQRVFQRACQNASDQASACRRTISLIVLFDSSSARRASSDGARSRRIVSSPRARDAARSFRVQGRAVQSFTVPSELATAKLVPSGLIATLWTQASWPFRMSNS